jgi:hypothetical protein
MLMQLAELEQQLPQKDWELQPFGSNLSLWVCQLVLVVLQKAVHLATQLLAKMVVLIPERWRPFCSSLCPFYRAMVPLH